MSDMDTTTDVHAEDGGDDQQQQGERQGREPQERSHLPEERSVPYERFAQVNKKARDLEKRLAELTPRLEEIEQRDQSELQRERSKRERYEREAAELSERLTRNERQAWLREAARDLKFEDPDDATAFVDVKGIEDSEDAYQAVKNLAKRKPRLLRSEPPEAKIGQVMQNGQRQAAQQAGQPQQAPLDPSAAAFVEQLRAAKESQGWQSIPLD